MAEPSAKVQPVGVAQTFGRAEGRLKPPVPVAIDQIFNDRPGLGDGVRTVGDHRRLAQWVHGQQFRRRQHGLGIALIVFNLVAYAKLLEQPEDALRA
jgi:hypothetical protein